MDYSRHAAFARYFEDLCKLYAQHAAFSERDFTYDGFKWINCDNADQSVFTYYRETDTKAYVVVLNCTPNSYEKYPIGVPYNGKYTELINTEKEIYEGCTMCNDEPIKALKKAHDMQPYRLEIRLAPLSGMIFQVSKRKKKKKSEEK